MAELFWEIRYAARVLARNPGFTALALCTLALGIAANTAIFTIFNSVLLRPLPFRDPARLAAIQEVVPRFSNLAPNLPVNARHFLEWRDHSHSFDDMALFGNATVNLTTGGEPLRLQLSRASASLFPLLGITPQLGRTFRPEEDRPGRDDVVVIGDGLWTRRFGRDPAIIGRKIVLDGKPYQVIGVLPSGVQLPRLSQLQAIAVSDEYAEVWKPFAVEDSELESMGDFNFGCMARLKPGVTLRQAEAELTGIQAELAKTFPEKIDVFVTLSPLQEQITGSSRQSLVLLLAAVGVVLLIVCVNIANLLLARATGRRREMAIRTAIGARASTVVHHLLTESLLLAACGGALGLLLARWSLGLLLSKVPLDLPRLAEVHMDWTVALFGLALAFASGLVFGIVPAWRMARTDPQAAMHSGGRSATEGRSSGRLRRSLIVAEVALSVMCLAAAGLLLHSFVRVMSVDKGFQTERAFSVTLRLPEIRYGKTQQQARFVRDLLDRVQRQPGVAAAGVSNILPLGGEGHNNLVAPQGTNLPLLERPLADIRAANSAFFQTLGIRLVSGRIFQESDGDRRVAVISSGLARRLWPGANPIGRGLIIGGGAASPAEVVGIVGDLHSVNLQKAPNPTVYLPYWQRGMRDVGLVVRSQAEAGGILAAVRLQIRSLDPELPVPRFQPLDDLVDASVAQRRFQLDLVLLFALAALLLAVLGVYGVVSHSVAQRTNEIGIRMALGASMQQVWRMVLRQGLTPVLTGLAAGLVGSLFTGRLLSGLLFGVNAWDPVTMAAVVGVLLVAAAVACYIPARRATRVDPLTALRYE